MEWILDSAIQSFYGFCFAPRLEEIYLTRPTRRIKEFPLCEVRGRELLKVLTAYLESNGFSFNLRHVLEDVVDNTKESFAFQETGLVLLENIVEVVEDEISSWNETKLNHVSWITKKK